MKKVMTFSWHNNTLHDILLIIETQRHTITVSICIGSDQYWDAITHLVYSIHHCAC